MTSVKNKALAFHRNRQQGVSLITVLVMMMLSLLLVLGGSRVSLLNERLSGNSTDYQRAYEAAEALLADAQLDLANMNGTVATRAVSTQFVCTPALFQNLQTTLSALDPPCADGICLDLGTESNGNPATSFWNDPDRLEIFTTDDRGARFGQYTNTAITAAEAVNPLLVDRGWYWVEVLSYGPPGSQANSFTSADGPLLNGWAVIEAAKCSIVFRVTAVAQGRRNGTTAVLQSLYSFRGPPPPP